MATSLMDFLGGGMFGGAGTYEDLLTEEQKRQMGQQSMMAMAAKLLQAGGPSDRPTSLGQALGGAYLTGQEAYEKAGTGAMNQMLTKQKIEQYKADLLRKQRWQDLVSGTATPMTASDALSAPVTQAMPAGPTVARANMIGQSPASVPGTPQSIFSGLPKNMRTIIGGLDHKEGMSQTLDLMGKQQKWSEPKPYVVNGKVVMIKRNDLGEEKVDDGTQPYEPLPTDIRAVEYLSGNSLGGGGRPAIKQVGQYREQISPKTTVNIPGQNDFLKGVGNLGSDRFGVEMTQAISANDTLRNIDTIAPALDKAILGPGADYRTVLTRVGVALGVGGKDDQERLNNTRQVVQGLAKSELDSAATMKGQGPLTDSERAIIRRMSAGEQNMTPDELRVGMGAIQKNALYRQQSYSALLQRAGTIQGFSNVAPMFDVEMYKPKTQLINKLNFGDAVAAELLKRKGNQR